jgi:CheY-like chemotaxis protein
MQSPGTEPFTTGQPRAVLLADDDSRFRSILAELLRDRGYPVIEAATGLDALIHLRRHRHLVPPGLILLDLQMPQMDGRGFRREQLADPVLAEIPVVLLSASGFLDGEAQVAAVDEYLAKPVALEELLPLVSRYCG